MNKDIDLKSINIKPLLAKVFKKLSGHALFAALFVVLLVYVIVVFKISNLAKAEPTPEQVSTVPTLIPKVDQKVINQIQSLEDNNTQIHSLFEQARNNPFQE